MTYKILEFKLSFLEINFGWSSEKFFWFYFKIWLTDIFYSSILFDIGSVAKLDEDEQDLKFINLSFLSDDSSIFWRLILFLFY